MTITNPAHLDGIEVYNAHARHNSRNDLAEMWAARYDLLPISGSDVHHDYDLPGGGILTDEPITDMAQLMQILRERRYTLLREGNPGDETTQKP